MKPLVLLLLVTFSCTNSIVEKKTNTSTDTFVQDSLPIQSESNKLEIKEVDTLLYKIKTSPKGKYSRAKYVIKQRQLSYRSSYLKAKSKEEKDSIITEAGIYIDETILNTIIPFWYGTEWDFSGYTHKPNDGFVGCSYFVSTTLLHSGFNLNRYYLAQQNPENEAKSLQLIDSLYSFEYSENFHSKLEQSFEDGLYFVGLDSHVGYLLMRKAKAFFINSSYMEPLCVEIQYAESSAVFISSIYHIVAIGNNQSLVQKWLLGEEINIVRAKK